MADNRTETSVFFQESHAQPRESVSGRPLIISSSSTTKRAPTPRHVYLFSQSKCRIFLLIVLLLLVVIIIALTLVFLRGKDGSTPTISISPPPSIMETTALTHKSCLNKTSLSGYENKTSLWTVYQRNDPGWNEVNLYMSTRCNVTSLAISPVFVMDKGICSLQISFNFRSDSVLDVYIRTSSQRRSIYMKSDKDACAYGYIEDREFFSNETSFRIVLESNFSIEMNGVFVSVTTHSCVTYASVADSAIIGTSPKYATIPLGTRNLCSLEFLDQTKADCDWWKVVTLGNSNFTRQENHKCVTRGVSHQENDGMSWFLSLNGIHSDTRAYLLSPILEGGSSHLILSLWYIFQCTGSKIRVFLLPSSRDITGIPSEISSVFELRSSEPSYQWKYNRTLIMVPPNYKSFQVVIEGMVTSLGNCSHHRCQVDVTDPSKPVKTPLLALDDISLEMIFDECNTSEQNVSVIDCRFQDSNNSTTSCLWTPSEIHHSLPYLPHDAFHDWKVTDVGHKQVEFFGANSAHLKDRGHILTFDASGKVGATAYVRSPLLIANSNCSCTMSFLYLSRGEWAPRLNVNLRLGENIDSEDRAMIPQFSVFGHQDEDWVLSRFPLNIQTEIPFQVEIEVKDIPESRGDVSIDDLFFINCDFAIYNS